MGIGMGVGVQVWAQVYSMSQHRYRTKNISPPPFYCFLVGAVTGRWSDLFLKGAVARR